MDIREKLVELLTNSPQLDVLDWTTGWEEVANYLIAHGVTVQELDSCKYCKEYEDLPEHFIDDKPIGRVFDTCIQSNKNGLWYIEVPCGADIGIQFCPMCGRKLPQPKGE